MNNLGLRQKFHLLSILFGLLLLGLLWISLGLTQDNTRLLQQDLPALNKTHELKLNVVQVQQWLTDISATRALDGLDDGFIQAEKHAVRVKQLSRELAEMFPAQQSFFQQLDQSFDDFYAAGRRMANTYVTEGPSAGNATMDQFDIAATAISEKVDALLQENKSETLIVLIHKQATLKRSRDIIIATIVVLGIILLLIFLLLNSALKALPLIGAEMALIAKGDLSERELCDSRDDEIGVLLTHVDAMKNSLRNVLNQVARSISELAKTIEQLTTISQTTEQGMQQQQSEVEQIATAMNEMSATAGEVARNAGIVADSSQTANTESIEGSRVMSDTVAMINSLAHDVEKTSDVIQLLEAESKSIGTILDVICGIAEQTNLLALNAAIEAARAGEQGRGFAVVADEVRTLAGRTTQSTQEIQKVIERLQSTSQDAVKAMAAGQKRAGESVTQAQLAGEKLIMITETVAAITDMNLQIASAAEEQSAVAEEMNRNITIINEVSDQTCESTEALSKVSHQLNREAINLNELVTKFVF